jgi:hypothetical protein
MHRGRFDSQPLKKSLPDEPQPVAAAPLAQAAASAGSIASIV